MVVEQLEYLVEQERARYAVAQSRFPTPRHRRDGVIPNGR